MGPITVTIPLALRERVIKDAAEQEENMSQVITRILADHYQAPELREIPRARAGRPPKSLASA